MHLMNRRALLGGLGGLVVGGSVAGLVGSFAQAAEAPKAAAPKADAAAAPTAAAPKAEAFKLTRFGQSTPPFSWKAHKLDLKEVGAVAHAGYHHQGYG